MGEVFAGRYELVDPIGRGGAGAVWRAWDHRRRRYVAAKVLQQSDAHALLRFVREQALRIDHPHVLAPASWAADDDKVLFTMDLVGGGSLAHLIGDYGPLPTPYVCTLLDQLLAGLQAVHAEGVVHRDIKPANILLEATGTRRPHLRLSDFGISMRKGEPRLTETNYVVGTPGYFAPEQMLGAEPDFPADLFAVGLVALYLLEGAKPDAKALIEYFADHGTPGAPQSIPEPLWQVVATLLQPDPQARFRTATGARKALAAAAELLPEPGPDDELVEVFDQLGPLPDGFDPAGPRPPEPPRSEPHAQTPQPPQAQAPAQTPAVTPQQPTPQPAWDTDGFHLAPPPRPAAPAHQDQQGHQAPVQPTRRPEPEISPAELPHPPAHPSAHPTELPHSHTPHTPPPSPQHPAHAPVPQQPFQAPHPALQDPSQALTAAVPHEYAPTRPYTAQRPQVPTPAPPVPYASTSPAHAPASTPTSATPTGTLVRQKRPGPPPKVAVPVLLLALLCFAVGIWALIQA
ncbi:protein kinase domain-containing protein [Streptomyces sp. NBC_01304]|uniref:protein kinase domain-containing protein n=1 Tax=Streptomyces sp. NBC_01304 TaxID=2903818 RepID=UPI002E115AA3|nr:protein kinase [Streptomyces sp. NBC_01304]